MKFFALAAAVGAASARHHHHQHNDDFVQLDARAELLSTAMSMTSSRAEAKALLESALHTIGGGIALSQAGLEANSQVVSVPIDEKKSLNLKVMPTYKLDTVKSVTLKAFRKIVGYDTFESIR